MNTKQFNYENVVNYKELLMTNREKMNNAFNSYQNELNRIDSNWLGASGSVSKEEMDHLMAQYNSFLVKVDDFINVLSNSEEGFITSEEQNAARYNV